MYHQFDLDFNAATHKNIWMGAIRDFKNCEMLQEKLVEHHTVNEVTTMNEYKLSF